MHPIMSHSESLAQVGRLRRWRVRSPRLDLADAFQRARQEYAATARSGQTLQQAWASLAGEHVGSGAMADRVVRGVLVVSVSTGAQQHACARWLRGGGALELSRAAGVPIRRWKFEYATRRGS